MNSIQYSVVIPVYNSKRSLEELFEKLVTVFAGLGSTFEAIFVDDASHDESWQLLKSIKNRNPETVKIIRLAKNFGQQSATFCGLNHSTGDFVVTIDDDMQYFPDDIRELKDIQHESQADVVYGTYKSKHPVHKKAASNLIRFGTKLTTSQLTRGTSFRLLTREIVDKLCTHDNYFVHIDEFLYWYTDHIAYATVRHQRSKKTDSGYSLLKLMFYTGNLIILYTTVPLKVMTYSGLILSVVSFAAAIFLILKKFIYGIPVQGFTALMVTVLFATSVMLICFGIIGEYLGRVVASINNKPTYSIKEKEL